MCVNTKLDMVSDATLRLMKRHKNKKQFVAYKVVWYSKINDCYLTNICDTPIEPGILVAKGDNGAPLRQTYTYGGEDVNGKSGYFGIHVYLNKKRARQDVASVNCFKKIVRVVCNINDLLVSDTEQAAFKAVYICPKMWKEDTSSSSGI